jgi:hypothetical protein
VEPDFTEGQGAFEDLYEAWMDYSAERAMGGTAEEEQRNVRAAARRLATKHGRKGPKAADRRAGKDNGC